MINEQSAPETPARRIVQKFGGGSNLARALTESGHPITRSAICHWDRPRARGGAGGMIPTRWVQPIIVAADRMHVDLQFEDFFPWTEAHPRPA